MLIGKKPDQLGINALQIEMFSHNENSIVELMDGVSKCALSAVSQPTWFNGFPHVM